MSQRSKPQPPYDGWVLPSHQENREKFPAEELEKFLGQVVAWNWEGTQIVASGDDHAALFQRLEQLGISPARVVIDVLDAPANLNPDRTHALQVRPEEADGGFHFARRALGPGE